MDLGAIEALIKEGRAAVEQQDDAKVQDVTTRLEKEAHTLASMLYEGTGAGPGGAAPPPGGGAAPGGDAPKKDVIDAEFEETN